MAQAENSHPTAADGPSDDHAWIHIVPVPILLGVFGALIVLTVLTVAVTYVDLGMWNLWIAMGIATVKASLVALFFMHLFYDRSFATIVFLAAIVFVGLFIGVVLLDALEYSPDIHSFQEQQAGL